MPRALQATDFRQSEAKQACRRFNLAGLENSLWIAPGGQLRLDWVELAGEGAPMLDLLRPKLGPGRFIGLDRDREVIHRLQAQKTPHTIFQEGVLQPLLLDRPELFENVGVINFDSLCAWFGEPIFEETTPLIEFVQQNIHRRREMMLIINAWTRNRPETIWMPVIQKVFAPLLGPRDRKVESDDIFRYPAQGAGWMVNVRIRLGWK